MSGHGDIRVGYAFREKRNKSLFTDELIRRGSQLNVSFVKIDPLIPLVDQGANLDIILHKLEGEPWEKQLAEYSAKFPDTIIVDKYENVHRLDDRLEMLEVVRELDSSQLGAAIEVPKQLNVPAGTDPELISSLVDEAGMKFPFVSKPTAANGTANAHKLSLVVSREALTHLEPPLVLQEFVNHGGFLFKLYVIGDKVSVFKRQSLPDIPKEFIDQAPAPSAELAPVTVLGVGPDGIPTAQEALHQTDSIESLIRNGAGLVEFDRISNVHLAEDEMHGQVIDPPPSLVHRLGIELRDRLGLRTFNVDVLREDGDKDRYFIVDINYMPGYERLPDFETTFLDFLLSLVAQKNRVKISADEGPSSDLSIPLAKKYEGLPLSLVTPYPLLAKKKWGAIRAAMRLASLGSGKKLM